MKESPADKLKALRSAKGFETAKAAADAYGWNEVTYRAHENGTRQITINAARKYAQAFGSSAGFILGMAGSIQSNAVNQVAVVSLLGRVSAGDFRYDDGVETSENPVPAVMRGDITPQSQYAVIVDGPSVNKRIPDGAYAICARYDSYPGGAQHGQLVHVVRERAGMKEHTIKELRFTPEGPTLFPVSTDPKHQEQIKLDSGDDGETVLIQGVVIGLYQPL